MKAAVWHGKGNIAIESRDLPEPSPGEVLLRIRTAGICGTDLTIYQGKFDPRRSVPPLVPGHEMCGLIEKLGQGVDWVEHWGAGDRGPADTLRALLCLPPRLPACLHFPPAAGNRQGRGPGRIRHRAGRAPAPPAGTGHRYRGSAGGTGGRGGARRTPGAAGHRRQRAGGGRRPHRTADRHGCPVRGKQQAGDLGDQRAPERARRQARFPDLLPGRGAVPGAAAGGFRGHRAGRRVRGRGQRPGVPERHRLRARPRPRSCRWEFPRAPSRSICAG